MGRRWKDGKSGSGERRSGLEGNEKDGTGRVREGGKGGRRGGPMSCLGDSNLTAIREGRVTGGGAVSQRWGCSGSVGVM